MSIDYFAQQLTPPAGTSISSGATPQQPFGAPQPYTGTANYNPRNTHGPGDTAAFLAAVNRQGQQAANQGQQLANNQVTNALNFYGNQAGLDPATGRTALGQAFIDRAWGNVANTFANRDYMGRLLNEDAVTGQRRLDLQAANTNVDQAALERRLHPGGYYDALQGLLGRDLANQLAGFDLKDLGSWQAAQTAQRGEISDATARGALQTEGTRADMSDIQKQLANQLTSSNLGREGARIGNEKEGLSLSEQRAQDRDRQQQLSNTAKDYGLQKEQLQTELQRGLEKLNIDSYVTVNDLMDKMNSSDINDRQAVQSLINSALTNSGAFPTYGPGSYAPSAPAFKGTSTGGGGRRM